MWDPWGWGLPVLGKLVPWWMERQQPWGKGEHGGHRGAPLRAWTLEGLTTWEACSDNTQTVSERRRAAHEFVGGSGSGASQGVPGADALEAVVAHCSVFRTPSLPSPPSFLSFLPSFLSFWKKFTKAFHVFTRTHRKKHWYLTPAVSCLANTEPIYNSRAFFSFIYQC